MKKRLKVAPLAELSMKEAFEEFVNAQSANGRAEQTLQNYRTHFHSISKHIDIEKTFRELKQSDIESMIVSMREHGLAVNSIRPLIHFNILLAHSAETVMTCVVKSIL